MKLFSRVFLITSCLIAIPTVIIPSLTSCSDNNPFTNTVTGDDVSIKNKKEATELEAIAITRIATSAPRSVSGADDVEALLFNALTNNYSSEVQADAYASSQVYWELVYYMCKQYTKDTSSISVAGYTTTNDRRIFLHVSEEEPNVSFKDGASMKCSNFLNNAELKGNVGYATPPDSKNQHFRLNFDSRVYIDSYALWAWTYSSSEHF